MTGNVLREFCFCDVKVSEEWGRTDMYCEK